MRHLSIKKLSDANVFLPFGLRNVLRATQGRALFRHLNFQKRANAEELLPLCLRNVLCTAKASRFSKSQFSFVFTTLTSKRVSRHKCAHFFDISTSKSGPTLKCLYTFDFEMDFAPQRRELFRHLNFQKWSDAEVLVPF